MSKELNQKYEELRHDSIKHTIELSKKLKPCPFCGDTPILDFKYASDEDGFGFWYTIISCFNCGCEMTSRSQYEDEMEARICSDYLVEKWNMRVKLKDEWKK